MEKLANKKTILIYLAFVYALAWGLWFSCNLAGFGINTNVYLVCSIVVMWLPALSVWLTKLLTKSDRLLACSVKPRIKGNVRWYLAAWFVPSVLCAVGAALYFLVFPGDFDPSTSMVQAAVATSGTPLSAGAMVAVTILSALLYAPLINMLAALGEELGWRAFLYPALAKRFSPVKAHLLVGLIWGVWHTPINMLGYNYGLTYPGFPWLGILAMSVFCCAMGVFLSWLVEKTGSVWPAALAHGAFNAAAGVPSLFWAAGDGSRQILGPGVNGFVAGIPMLILAIVLLVRWQNPHAKES